MPSVYPRLRARVVAGSALAGAAIALFAGAASASASVADALIYPPYVPPLGKTYSQYGASWWQWALKQPADVNPITDTTGANCGQGQSGLVWYLAGTFGDAGAVTRNCTIPFGKTIVIPVANGLYGAFPTDPADQRTEAFVRSQVTPQLKGATNLQASIDGSSVTNVSRYFEESTLFNFTFGANNVYGLPAGTQLAPAADAGYYLALYPLLPGNHTLKVSSTVPGAGSVDVTYKIKVPLF